MKRIQINEKWCLSCHLCEYYCSFAATGMEDMVKALKGVKLSPRILVEESGGISFAVSCRHCEDPLCLKGCIAGAISLKDGVVCVDKDRCVGCYTCVLSCPYGAIFPTESGPVKKCQLCMDTQAGVPACASHCPNNAIVYQEGGIAG